MAATPHPTSDSLTDKLLLSVLYAGIISTATVTTSAELVLVTPPMSVAFLASVADAPDTGDTVDIVVQGRDKSTDSWVTVATFTTITDTVHATQRKNITPSSTVELAYKRYQAVITTVGAFSADLVPVTVVLCGTDLAYAPAVQPAN